MTKRNQIRKYNKLSKIKTSKIGACSINDIINNTPELSFSQKVNWIRHHYTYYDGNCEMFHTEDGKPNQLKNELNKLIIAVLNKKADPSALKEFNKRIMKWRSAHPNLRWSKHKEIFVPPADKSILCTTQWEKAVANNMSTAKDYVAVIRQYLSQQTELSKHEIDTISYKELKRKALLWQEEEKWKGNL